MPECLRLGTSPSRCLCRIKPSIAVLPFTNLSGDSDQDYFCDGLVEDIITALSRFKALFVIARNSSFTYRGGPVDVRRVGRELGVRYVLEGSVRRAGNRVRITGQLIEADTAAHIWAETYDGLLEDIFQLQDTITTAVAGAIEPKLLGAEINRAIRKAPESLSAYDLYLRALPHAHMSGFHSPESNTEALRLLRGALKLDPKFSYALALSAWCYFLRRANGWSSGSDDEHEGREFVERALRLDPDDPTVLWIAGYVLPYLKGEHARALELTQRAVRLNPSSAPGWAAHGWALNFLGRGDEAIPCLERAKRLSPFDPMSPFFDGGIGVAHATEGRFAEAIEWLELTRRETSPYSPWNRALAAAYARAGRADDARRVANEILTHSPGFTISKWAAQGPMPPGPARDRFLEGLRLAGLPE